MGVHPRPGHRPPLSPTTRHQAPGLADPCRLFGLPPHDNHHSVLEARLEVTVATSTWRGVVGVEAGRGGADDTLRECLVWNCLGRGRAFTVRKSCSKSTFHLKKMSFSIKHCRSLPFRNQSRLTFFNGMFFTIYLIGKNEETDFLNGKFVNYHPKEVVIPNSFRW